MSKIIKGRLSYDTETGEFVHLSPMTKKVKPGQIAGCLTERGYRYVYFDGKGYRASQPAWFFVYGVWPSKHIDHINCDRDDNRISNLREATRSQNNANVKARRDGLKGCYLTKKNGCWRAVITVNHKQNHLGYFSTEADAHAAYVSAAKKIRGEFARS